MDFKSIVLGILIGVVSWQVYLAIIILVRGRDTGGKLTSFQTVPFVIYPIFFLGKIFASLVGLILGVDDCLHEELGEDTHKIVGRLYVLIEESDSIPTSYILYRKKG